MKSIGTARAGRIGTREKWQAMWKTLSRTLQRVPLPFAIIVTVSGFAHGFTVLMDGVYWDSWLIVTYFENRDWYNLFKMFSENGSPITAYLHYFMSYVPNTLFGYRSATFVVITLSGILVYAIGRETGFVSRLESLSIALLSLTFPAYQTIFLVIIFPSTLFYCLFLVAVFLALRSEQSDGRRHLVLRVSALACFALFAFWIKSLLVFYFGFLLLLFLFVWRQQELTLRQVVTWLLPRRLDYIVLPFVFWFAAEGLFPVHGLYANYNRPSFSPMRILLTSSKSIQTSINGQLTEALELFLLYPAYWVVLGIVTLWGYSGANLKSASFAGSTNPFLLFGAGILLLGTGIFPYAAVGKAATLFGYNSRFALLVGLPVAIIMTATVRIVFARANGTLSRGGMVLSVLFLGAFILKDGENYIHWQARWVKDRSVMEHLRQEDPGEISVFWVEDEHPAGSAINYEHYRFYEYSTIFNQVWGDETRIGLDRSKYEKKFLAQMDSRFYTSRYVLSEFDPEGCQAIMTIRKGKREHSDYGLVARYYFYKFLRGEESLRSFLLTVSNVQIEPIDAPEAVHCRR